eukprot:TRINITY_DN2431_c0_g1_i2.p1 TRINITY_DN2431_c0_g1~~TRINITY_DN2431_c0_g1_i2.p1  ORF type:complete len:258 (-),score=26.38 TRINITY_DN2431_c0_g1_i2:1225-1953(-)
MSQPEPGGAAAASGGGGGGRHGGGGAAELTGGSSCSSCCSCFGRSAAAAAAPVGPCYTRAADCFFGEATTRDLKEGAGDEWLRMAISTVIVAAVLVATIASQFLLVPPFDTSTANLKGDVAPCSDCGGFMRLASSSFYLALISILMGTFEILSISWLLKQHRFNHVRRLEYWLTLVTCLLFSAAVYTLAFATSKVHKFKHSESAEISWVMSWLLIVVSIAGALYSLPFIIAGPGAPTRYIGL